MGTLAMIAAVVLVIVAALKARAHDGAAAAWLGALAVIAALICYQIGQIGL